MRCRWTVIGALAAVAVWALGAEPWLELDRAAVAAGESWRMITAHWTHWSTDHLAWDLAVFVVLGVLAETRSRAAFIACVALSAAAISIVVIGAQPAFMSYRGLSGVDSALFALVLTTLGRDAWLAGRRGLTAATVAVGALFAAKTAWEAATGGTVFVDAAEAGFVAAPAAHLAGAAVGVAVACGQRALPLRRRRRRLAVVG